MCSQGRGGVLWVENASGQLGEGDSRLGEGEYLARFGG
jgi:hypothetical protein